MNKKFEMELEALAEKYGLSVSYTCAYCERKHESLWAGETCHMVTFVEKDANQ
jgi:hypothetical protein